MQAFAERASTFWAPRQRGGRKESDASPRQVSTSSSSSSWSASLTNDSSHEASSDAFTESSAHQNELVKNEMTATTDASARAAAALTDDDVSDLAAGEKEDSGSSTGMDSTKGLAAGEEDEEEAARIAQEVPGRIVHLYKRLGATIAAVHCQAHGNSMFDDDNVGAASSGEWAYPPFLRRIDPQVEAYY